MTKQPRFLEMSRGGCLTLWMVVAALGFAGSAYSQTFAEFPIPGTVPTPWGITAGPDGNLWFTEFAANKIGRISTTGVISDFAVPTLFFPQSIVAGSDGALWFISQTGKIGRITTAGAVTEFAVTADSLLTDITSGPDGNLWFTETDRSTVGGGPSGRPKIGRLTTAGVVTEFPLSPVAQPLGIAAGPDGALWFADANAKIGRMTTAGVITEFPVPATNPRSITAGPDGNLWFTETTYSFIDNPAAGRIGRISTSGVVTEFPIPTANSSPSAIAAGPDGALWFTEGPNYLGVGGNNIGRITTAGVVTEFPIPTGRSIPSGITAGPDGALWFTEEGGFKIGRITTSGALCGLSFTNLCLNKGRFRVEAAWTTSGGAIGAGQAVGLVPDAGYFWFFDPNNPELLAKVLDGCSLNNHYWVFAAGLTNVSVALTVTDTQTGQVAGYINPQGTAFQPIQDIRRFGCP